MSRAIHVLGANGFPIAMYRPIIQRLRCLYNNNELSRSNNFGKHLIEGSDVYHQILISEDWKGMVDAAIQSIEKRGVGPVVGIGHSMVSSISIEIISFIPSHVSCVLFCREVRGIST
jgi:hypothetical protein